MVAFKKDFVNCDICEQDVGNEYVDGKTNFGPWANMCMTCFNTIGVGIGVGRGQKYEHRGKSVWEKIAG